jgi:hypothetical protein
VVAVTEVLTPPPYVEQVGQVVDVVHDVAGGRPLAHPRPAVGHSSERNHWGNLTKRH